MRNIRGTINQDFRIKVADQFDKETDNFNTEKYNTLRNSTWFSLALPIIENLQR